MSSKFTIVALALTALTTGAGAGTLQSRGSVATRQDNLRAAFPDRRGNPDEGDPRLLWDNRDECNYEESSSNINCGVIISTPEQGNSTIFGGTSSSTPKATSPLTTAGATSPLTTAGATSPLTTAGATSPLTTTPTPQATTEAQPTSNDTLATEIERTGIIVKTNLPIINLTPAPVIEDVSGSQSGGATSYNETISGKSNSQEGAFPFKEVAIGGGAGVLALGGFLYRLFSYSAPPAPQRIIVEGVGVAAPDPARARADLVNVNGQGFGNQQQHPRLAVLDPENLNFRPNVVRGLNGRN